MDKQHDKEFADLDDEMKQITDFFDEVEKIKKKILNEFLNKNIPRSNIGYIAKENQIKSVLSENINLINVISDDTIKIYMDTFFHKTRDQDIYQVSEDALEQFLTSISIFKKD